MNSIRKKHLKLYGYLPSDSEILDLYQTGQLLLTDKQENDLIIYFNL